MQTKSIASLTLSQAYVFTHNQKSIDNAQTIIHEFVIMKQIVTFVIFIYSMLLRQNKMRNTSPSPSMRQKDWKKSKN